jgi:hypothetical protein
LYPLLELIRIRKFREDYCCKWLNMNNLKAGVGIERQIVSFSPCTSSTQIPNRQ